MHPRLQAKLLRAIQEREIDRVGGMQPIKVDIRLIATSNRDLDEPRCARATSARTSISASTSSTCACRRCASGPRDIELLAEHFAKKYAEANGAADRGRSRPAAREMLTRHAWRGNVRELENTMHRAVLLARGDEIEPEAIMLSTARAGPTTTAQAGCRRRRRPASAAPSPMSSAT